MEFLGSIVSDVFCFNLFFQLVLVKSVDHSLVAVVHLVHLVHGCQEFVVLYLLNQLFVDGMVHVLMIFLLKLIDVFDDCL